MPRMDGITFLRKLTGQRPILVRRRRARSRQPEAFLQLKRAGCQGMSRLIEISNENSVLCEWPCANVILALD
jgi:hypothetical protein